MGRLTLLQYICNNLRLSLRPVRTLQCFSVPRAQDGCSSLPSNLETTRMPAQALLGATRVLRLLARGCLRAARALRMRAQNACSSLPRHRQSTQNACPSLLQKCHCAQNGCSSMLRSRLSAQNSKTLCFQNLQRH